ncbi:MAG: hypothetical protein IPJ79_06310 [Bacteroidetes bacterium]|nr:hypothetical protein [Bacteroidota bacterium]
MSQTDTSIPPGFNKYLNDCLDEVIMLFYKTEYYKSLKGLKISIEQKLPYPLWISNNMKKGTIYISPYLIRAAFALAYNQNYKLYEMLKKSKKTYYTDMVKMKYADISYLDLHSYNSMFKQMFVSELSFLIQHELAHIYLGENHVPETNELRCDCYAFQNYKLPFVFGGTINFAGKAELGIYKQLLQTSIMQNKPEYWDAQNVEQLKLRFFYVDSIFPKLNLNQEICDSIAKSVIIH